MIQHPKEWITVVTIPKARIAKFDIAMAANPVEIMRIAYYRLGKPTFMLNGGFFNTKTGETASNLVVDKVRKGTGCSPFGLIKDNGGVRFGDIGASNEDFIGGTPALVLGGKVHIDQSYGKGFNESKHPRSAVGENQDNIYLVAIDGRQVVNDVVYEGMTLQQLAEFMISIGCTNAINLDGGGSTRLAHNGIVINTPTEDRAVDNFICVWMKEEPVMHKVYVSASTQDKNIGVGDYGTEQDRMHQLADRVAYWLKTQKGKFEVFRNQKGWTLDQTTDDCNAKGAELFLDNHTNAPDSGGTEAYFHDGSKNGERIANLLYSKIAPISPCKDRGVHPDTSLYDSGLKVLRETKPPAALIEHIFHTNLVEVKHFLVNMELYAKAEAMAICEYFDEKWVEPGAITCEVSAPEGEWVSDGIEYLAAEGIIKDKDLWITKRNEYMPVWGAANMMMGIMKRLKVIEDVYKGRL